IPFLWLFGDGREAHKQKQQSRSVGRNKDKTSGSKASGVYQVESPGSCPRGGQVAGRGLGQGSVGGTRPIGGKRNKGAYRLIIGSWNIGILTGKSIELAKILQKRKGKNGVGILVDRELRESVIEVRRVSDRLMAIKLVVGRSTLNVISAYAPQVGLDEEVKRRFWEELDKVVRGTSPTEKLFIGGDFNGHIGSSSSGYGEVHGGFGCGVRNGGGTSLLDFARAFELVIVNSIFSKKEEHLITFRSMVAKTQIDYLLLLRCDKGLCEDC
uniref:Craniofacial development protein 2-like n=1 Tax=Nicotiana tabacum TaxID=4097 RepID=A0A1S3ZHN9_TOBAC